MCSWFPLGALLNSSVNNNKLLNATAESAKTVTSLVTVDNAIKQTATCSVERPATVPTTSCRQLTYLLSIAAPPTQLLLVPGLVGY